MKIIKNSEIEAAEWLFENQDTEFSNESGYIVDSVEELEELLKDGQSIQSVNGEKKWFDFFAISECERIEKRFSDQEQFDIWMKKDNIEVCKFDAENFDPDCDIILDSYIGGIAPFFQEMIVGGI